MEADFQEFQEMSTLQRASPVRHVVGGLKAWQGPGSPRTPPFSCPCMCVCAHGVRVWLSDPAPPPPPSNGAQNFTRISSHVHVHICGHRNRLQDDFCPPLAQLKAVLLVLLVGCPPGPPFPSACPGRSLLRQLRKVLPKPWPNCQGLCNVQLLGSIVAHLHNP